MEPKKPALSSTSESEKASGPWRPTKKQVLWVIGMVVALLTTALLIVNLHPEIWKGLLEERKLTLIAIGVSLAAIIVLLAIGGATSGWTGFRGKTVWDLLQLLIVPLALAVIGFLFTMQQDSRQQDIENQRAQQAQKIENKRAKAERELAVQRAQDDALQAYLDQMSALLLEKDLRASDEDSEVRTLARARTLTMLARLDPSRKTAVIEFLVEAELVQRTGGREPIIRLSGANVEGANLTEADLSGAYLSGADLCETYLNDAELGGTHLSGAYLCNAELRDADLRSADLKGVDLSGAYLREADLSHVEGVTNEELEQQAYSLKDATMPNGQKYEEWLKDKEGSRGDEENK